MTPNASGYNSAEISLDSFTLVIKSYENSYLDMLNLYQMKYLQNKKKSIVTGQDLDETHLCKLLNLRVVDFVFQGY